MWKLRNTSHYTSELSFMPNTGFALSQLAHVIVDRDYRGTQTVVISTAEPSPEVETSGWESMISHMT